MVWGRIAAIDVVEMSTVFPVAGRCTGRAFPNLGGAAKSSTSLDQSEGADARDWDGDRWRSQASKSVMLLSIARNCGLLNAASPGFRVLRPPLLPRFPLVFRPPARQGSSKKEIRPSLRHRADRRCSAASCC